jgi:hypothetical protein
MVIYQAKNGALELRGDFSHETLWATQAQIAEMFDVTPQNITLHINNIYKDKELNKKATGTNTRFDDLCRATDEFLTEYRRTRLAA